MSFDGVTTATGSAPWQTERGSTRTIAGDEVRPSAENADDQAKHGDRHRLRLQDGHPAGKDPDSYSPTLRRYHRLLWSKPLPSGAPFELSATTPRVYLHHSSALGEFFLSSDAAIATFTRWTALKPITEQLPESENEAFRQIAYTIGGMMVFPGNQIDRQLTINQARGCNSVHFRSVRPDARVHSPPLLGSR